MPGTTNNASASPDGFFNDLSRTSGSEKSSSPRDGPNNAQNAGGDSYSARPKRIACTICRKRKLKCDGEKPACGTCSRLGHDCAYDEVRKKSGPKRGYVKLLEQRLKQVENLLGTKDLNDYASEPPAPVQEQVQQPIPRDIPNMARLQNPMEPFPSVGFNDMAMDPLLVDLNMAGTDDFSWELLSLGLDESLPGQDIIDDLNQIYFEKIHPSLPMIHRPRFFASMDLAPHMRPPVCLRYAMWTQVCSITPRYSDMQQHFYARARKYAEADEMRGHGEGIITLAHAQTWALLAALEFKMMFFPRAWMSCGRANRLVQMMGLHRQDGFGLDVKQCLPPPRDWTEKEERRRTFWMAFCNDRYASIGTGWPMTIDEQDILTNLPASEEAYNAGRPEQTPLLSDAMTGDGAAALSPFAGVILMATLFGRNLLHLHRPTTEDNDGDLNGEFWKRHRALDNILLNTSLSMPAHLRLPAGIFSANIVFLNMNIHTSTICLHQAAIFKADKNSMAPQISAESKRRCIIAADQITNIMKMISHIDLSMMNPFMAFCLYVAARVFVQYLKSRKDDITVKSSLYFLLSAMQALKAKNPLTESFLVQLDVDLEGSGLNIAPVASRGATGLPKYPGEIPVNTDTVHCSPLYEIRESQGQGQNGPSSNSNNHKPLQTNSGMPMDFASQDFSEFSDMGYFTQNPSTTKMPDRSRQSSIPTCYGNSGSIVEIGLSPNNSSGSEQRMGSGSHSGQPTPSVSTGSYKGSSHTPFTPPQVDDGFASYTAAYNVPTTASTHDFDNYNQQNIPNVEVSQSTNMPYVMPASWDFSTDAQGNNNPGMENGDLENASSSTGMAPGRLGMTPFVASDSGVKSLPGNAKIAGKGNETRGSEWMFTTGWSSGAPTTSANEL